MIGTVQNWSAEPVA
ncbi:UNVERIFIED_CONTAM: hypothetical protein GTU68_067468 [Idotea baltica]|nr:hypothetical protein [Idotea baltica]